MRNNRHYFTFEPYHIARNNTFLHSFLPKTIKEWNSLSVEARSATNLRFFKMKIRPLPVNTSSVLQNPRYPSIIYTRIRNNCSALNAHLYHANLIASPMCDCNTGPENTFHFLYNCPIFDTERERLMLELDSLGLVDLSIPVLFQCDQHLDPPIIPSVQKAVFRYILNTKRSVRWSFMQHWRRCDPDQRPTITHPFIHSSSSLSICLLICSYSNTLCSAC